MHVLIYLLLGLVLLWWAYTTAIWLIARSAKGRELPAPGPATPELTDLPPKALMYWHSPACGPCRRMGPMIDELRQDGAPVVKLEVSEHLDLARELGIKAIPTLLLVVDGRIEQVVVGACSPSRMRKLLA